LKKIRYLFKTEVEAAGWKIKGKKLARGLGANENNLQFSSKEEIYHEGCHQISIYF